MQLRKLHPLVCARNIIVVCVMMMLGALASAQAQQPPPAPPAAPEFKLVIEPQAVELLKAASARLAAAKAMSFTAVVGYEYPSKLGPPILYTVRYDVALQRPNKLRILTPGDGPASEFYYDGKMMMAYSPAEDLVAVADAPPAIDATLEATYKTADIYYPFTDLILADPYAALADKMNLAFIIGPSAVVGGTKTQMVVAANDDVFLQLWIGADDKLPYRIRAIYKADPLWLRHDMTLSNWQLDPVLAADVFGSAKARSGKRMPFASPVKAGPAGAQPPSAAPQSKP